MKAHLKQLSRYDLGNSSDDYDKKQIKTKYQNAFLNFFLKHMFWGSNFEAVNLLQKSDLNEKSRTLQVVKITKI